MRPLVTESFSNKAALGTGSFPTDGSAPTRTAAAASLTVRYDAATDSYTITNGARSQTFRQSDVTTQDAVQRIYTRTAGSTTDTLLLTEPGTSGALTYQYVGSGSWQRTVQGASTVNATVDAFVYGAPTPAGNVPSSGSAGFAVDLIGTAGPTSYAGDGQLSVDFARGELLLDIEVNEIMDGGAVNPFAQRFSGNGAIASGNAFSGSFRLPFFEQYSGTFNGQFFGPASEEVGAAFFGTGTLPGSAIVGTIMGRRGGSATNTNLLNLNSDQQFAARVTDIFLAEAISDKRPLDFFTPSRTAATLHYDADTRSFRYQQAGAWDVTFEEPSRSISPDGRFILFDAGGGQTLALYRPGPDNSQLQLTYASFGAFRRNFDEPAFDRRGFGYDYFAYGITTAAMPTSGSASYSGIVVGQGVSSRAHYDLAGSTDLDVNFAGGGLTGTLSIAGVERQLGRTVNFGTFAFTGAVDRLAATLTGSSADGFGSIDGSFFGPAAVEFAATFAGFRGTDASLPGNIVHMGGALVGKKD
ncbi:MAG TPA: transferrin-binding protein-like solute binding protein [Croceibacterium sp.]